MRKLLAWFVVLTSIIWLSRAKANAQEFRDGLLIGPTGRVYDVIIPDDHASDRQAIEIAYRRSVLQAIRQFQVDGNQYQYESSREAAELEREAALGAIYPVHDELLPIEYRSFLLFEDQPYQPFSVNVAGEIILYRPWAAYTGYSWSGTVTERSITITEFSRQIEEKRVRLRSQGVVVSAFGVRASTWPGVVGSRFTDPGKNPFNSHGRNENSYGGNPPVPPGPNRPPVPPGPNRPPVPPGPNRPPVPPGPNRPPVPPGPNKPPVPPYKSPKDNGGKPGDKSDPKSGGKSSTSEKDKQTGK